MLFEVHFSTGIIRIQVADNVMQAAILAQAYVIKTGRFFQIDLIINDKTGKKYRIEQKIIEVKNDKSY